MMEIKKKIIPLIILLITASISSLFAQWNINLGTSQSYSDNPFNSPLPLSTVISSIDLGLEREIASFGLGYYGNYSIFHNLSDRDYYWHQFGLWNSSDNYMCGLFVEQRFNSANYEFYNFSNYTGYFKNRFAVGDINIFANASIGLTKYSSIEDLDNILLSGGLVLNKSLESKTTLIGGIYYNYKNYFSTDLKDADLVGDSIYSSNSKAYTNQFSYLLRIAQSITDNTGLAIQYSNQRILDGTAKTIRQLEFIYGDESQYFDDPISYNGSFITAQLTQLLGLEMIFKAKVIFGSKGYPSQGTYLDAVIFDQTKIRKDEFSIYDISITKYFYVGTDSQKRLDLTLSYHNRKNQSNSYWYHYNAGETSLSIEFQF